MQTNLFAFRIFAAWIMENRIEILKGIHPGKVIGRELKRRALSQRLFASTIGVHSQTLNAVIVGRRNITTEMAVKIEEALGFQEGLLLTLQAFYDIAEYKRVRSLSKSVEAPNVRRILFWDTDFDKIDWLRYKRAVINRVLERGNEQEKQEIARFYGLSQNEHCSYNYLDSYRLNILNEE